MLKRLDAASTGTALIALAQLLFQILNQAIESFRGGRIKHVGYQSARLSDPSFEFLAVVFLNHRAFPIINKTTKP
jgi:hypothetical protein